MSGVSYFRYSDTILRDMTVFEATQLESCCRKGATEAYEYFLDTYPFLYVSGSITSEVIEEQPSVAEELYNNYLNWLYTWDEQEAKHLERDIRVCLSGKKVVDSSYMFPYFINLFLPLINQDNGKLIRGVWATTIADEPYKNYRIIQFIQSAYCSYQNDEMKKRMKMKGKK